MFIAVTHDKRPRQMLGQSAIPDKVKSSGARLTVSSLKGLNY
jgi:hypothetical protein